MGASYNTLYLQTTDRKRVRQVLQSTAGANCRFMLAPPIDGWIAVYPNDEGQANEVLETIARDVGGNALYVYVYHSDVFGYQLFRDGATVDEFCSMPGYGQEASPEEQQRYAGKVEQLAAILPDPRRLAALEAIVHPPEGHVACFAEGILMEFAREAGLPNPLLCYDEMTDEYAPKIWRVISGLYQLVTARGRFRFEHIPDRKPERRRRRQRSAERASRIEQLRVAGPLLYYENEKKGWFSRSEPEICGDSSGRGFLVASESRGLREISPPWNERPWSLDLGGAPERMRRSPSGRLLVVATRGESCGLEVWDVESSRRLFQWETYANAGFDFSRDEQRLLSFNTDELLVLDVASGKRIARLKKAQGAFSACFDPRGETIVVSDYQELAQYDIGSGRRLRRWVLGAPVDYSDVAATVQEEMHDALAGFGPQETEKHLRRMGKYLKFSESQLKQMMDDVRQAQEGLRETLESDEWLDENSACGSESARRVAFHPNGQWLLCGTNRGLHLYDWEGMLHRSEAIAAGSGSSSERLSPPAPLFFAPGETYREDGEEEFFRDDESKDSDVNSFACDAAGDRLLFAGMGGGIGSLNLKTGESRTLVEVPGRPTIQQLALSGDGQTLACTTFPQLYRDTPKLTPGLYIWDYPALLRMSSV